MQVLEESSGEQGDGKMRVKHILVLTSILLIFAAAPLLCSQAHAQTQYSVTIWGWDYIRGWQVPVKIYRDGVDTGFTTPATFFDQIGTHTYTVPPANSEGHPFSDWDVGGSNWTDTTITVSSGGTFTARYRAGYSITIWGWDYIQGWAIPVPISIDGSSSGFSTPHTFTDLIDGTHTFTVPYTNTAGHPFSEWSNNWTSPTLTVYFAGVYTARYREGYSITIKAECDSIHMYIPRPITLDGSYTGFSTPHTFYLIGTHTIEVPGNDEDGHPFYGWNEGSSSSPTLTVNSAGVFTAKYRIPPSGSIVINGGATYTTSTSVTLSLTYEAIGSTVSQVRYSNDGVWDTEVWESPAASKSWVLAAAYGDGVIPVYFQVRDSVGMLSLTYEDTIILDTTPPTGSIYINMGLAYTSSTGANLALAAQDPTPGSGVAQVRYSNDGVSWTTWESFASYKSWTLTSGDGVKTVYCQVKDVAGLVSSTFNSTIILDTTPPTYVKLYINLGAAYTNSTKVSLAVAAGDSGGLNNALERFSNDGASWSNWFDIHASYDWTLTPGDGIKTVYIQLKDNAGLVNGTESSSIILDTMPPTGSILINGGAASTSSTSVTLALSYTDALSGVSQVRYSNDGASWTAWETSATSKPWTLTPGEGTKTVYYQIKDNAGLTSTAYTDTVNLQNTQTDTTPPTGLVTINGGEATANSVSVVLTVSATDAESGISQMRFSNDGTSWSPWEAYSTSKSWSTTPGEGLKTVYVQFKNGAGLDSISYSDTITLQTQTDTTPPTGSITINGNAATTNSVSVVLTLSAADPESGVTQMHLSNDGSSWSTWETYVTSKAWTLTSGDASKTVYVQFKNGAGLESTSYSDSITLQFSSSDTTPPTGSITINGGAATTSSVSVTLTLSATDNSGTVAQMHFTNLGESWTSWEPYATTKTWTLTSGTGTKTVLAQFRDASSIESAPYGDTIVLDTSFEEKTFNLTVGPTVYTVVTRSNTSITDFSFNQALKRIRFNANATTGITGFTNITIPAALISGDFSLFMDDTQLVKDVGYTQAYNGTHYTFSFGHGSGVHAVEIFGTNVIPEFPSAAMLILPVALASALALIVRGKLKPRR